MSATPREHLLARIREGYPAIASDLLQPLLRFMTVGRGNLGGDTDKILVMLVIAVRTTQHPEFRDYTVDELMDGEVAVLPSLGINIRSIADSTGMPKETVRRKVGELVDAGWLIRDAHNLRYTAEGFAAVSPAREAIEDMAARYFEVVRRLPDGQPD
ncbi:hypothetical protein [Phenylobacterium sp.]|jgi:hypothetical protein|uniref:hypothetical protein n=1 Tax=Phenylobacterium sp. TaxID=1871053 RepID=UPI002F9346C8